MKFVLKSLLVLFILQSCNVSDISKYLKNGMDSDDTRHQLNGQGYEGNDDYGEPVDTHEDPDPPGNEQDNQKESLYTCISLSNSTASIHLQIQEDEYGDKFIYDNSASYKVNETVFDNPRYGDVIYHSSGYSLMIKDKKVLDTAGNFTWFESIATLNISGANVFMQCRQN